MFERIPLPNPTNYKMFDDVFDYLEEIRKRKSGEKAKAAELEENKRQFGITSALDREKLNELAKYHQGRLALQQHLAEMKAQEANSAKKTFAAGTCRKNEAH